MVTVTIDMHELNWQIRNQVENNYSSVREAARALDVAPQTVINWTHGSPVRLGDADMQRKLAGFLGVSPLEVLRMAGFDLDHRPANLTSAGHTDPGLRFRAPAFPSEALTFGTFGTHRSPAYN